MKLNHKVTEAPVNPKKLFAVGRFVAVPVGIDMDNGNTQVRWKIFTERVRRQKKAAIHVDKLDKPSNGRKKRGRKKRAKTPSEGPRFEVRDFSNEKNLKAANLPEPAKKAPQGSIVKAALDRAKKRRK